MNKTLKKNREAIEKSLVERHGAVPLGKEEYKNCHIWVGECWRNDDPRDFPWGYYQGFYMIGRNEEKLCHIQEVMFDAFHDPSIPRHDRQRARKNKLLKDAKERIDGMNGQVSFYR